jgi:hypothetical protein
MAKPVVAIPMPRSTLARMFRGLNLARLAEVCEIRHHFAPIAGALNQAWRDPGRLAIVAVLRFLGVSRRNTRSHRR